ncbi:MAG: TolC family protein [Alistipes sp.]|nr:TolC family protein [Alistipes sp.]
MAVFDPDLMEIKCSLKRIFILLLIMIGGVCSTPAQVITLTMEEAIAVAQIGSLESEAVGNTFLSNYWRFRSFNASMLPSLNLNATLANFERSLRPLQDYNTGEITYRSNYNMYNSLYLSIDQNIAATGGTLSLYSSLTRLDQWRPNKSISYYSQPITLSYLQPFRSYNSFKWDKKIEPVMFDKAKLEYLEQIEDITSRTVRLFYDLLLYKINYEIAVSNYENTRTMYSIASQRFLLGSVNKSELLQLELRMINDSLAISTNENNFLAKKLEFKSFLRIEDVADIDLAMSEDIPQLNLDPDYVLNKALQNSSFLTSQQITLLESERNIAIEKGSRGMSIGFSTQFGLSNNANDFRRAYSNLMDQEIVAVTFRIPIMDWGMGRGREKVARARHETVLNRIDQATIDYRNEIYRQVLEFNSQRGKCLLAHKARQIAEERYRMTIGNFSNGTATVTDLNTAQTEKDEAQRNYIGELANFWISYFNLRKTTLYDFISGSDISARFDELIK